MAVISQTPDERAIQGQIADKLGLSFDDKESVAGRADRLQERMITNGKKILVILDDIWKKLDFEKLAKEEAWKLFQESAGSCVDDPLLHPIAEAVADECAGLPLAIAIVGRALENKTDRNVWAYALQQLKKSAPRNIIPEMDDVFSSIQFSYDYLESKEAKSCFLLCMEHHVKMHRLVRDFAISIASKAEPMLLSCDVGLDEWPQKDSYEHYIRIPLQFSKNAKFLVDTLQFTNLKLLQLFYNSQSVNHMDKISGNFFEGMKVLAVLALFKNHTPMSLPSSLEVLKNLRSLFLHGCRKMEGLLMIGGL
ncbi:probable disease resistance protein At4g27220 [Ziziphus jujuba]|uniref:Probable disease resistance protein At4g27220 n=1 Tax=Ziziphus jujuba TaxID=326968 RepID=A0ABM3IVZ8_ZIZJJ|nr:probable disease resistance protein At4g27220 [Ziziphus jujuba]